METCSSLVIGEQRPGKIWHKKMQKTLEEYKKKRTQYVLNTNEPHIYIALYETNSCLSVSLEMIPYPPLYHMSSMLALLYHLGQA